MSPRPTRRLVRPIALSAAATLALAACSGSSMGGDDESEESGPVKLGLLLPMSGVYSSLGEDMKQGFDLYLENNDGQLGGHDVEIIVGDEGETADTGRSAAEKLLKQDEVLAVSGVVSSATMNSVKDMFESEEVPLVGSNASPTTLEDVDYIWRTSYINDDAGTALGSYVAEHIDGDVYLIAADYQAGKDQVEGFKSTFEPAGGTIAETAYTPFPDTTNFQPYLADIQQSGASAVFAFYAGGAAVDFVKQYEEFGLAGEIPLYSPGFLTEGGVLNGQGDSAIGTFTAMNYSADLDNEVNQSFVEEYQEAYDEAPTTYAMSSYDAAQVLDKAIESAGDDVTSASINEAIAEVGDIDSPRGTWHFTDNKTPQQMWYLREVQKNDSTLSNIVVDELGQMG